MAAGLPTAVLIEIEFTSGVWTDVASSVPGQSLRIHVGRDSAAGEPQPGVLTFDLDNTDGTFFPDNPQSTYWPNLTEGKRVRVRVTKGTTSTRFLGRIVQLEPTYPTSSPDQGVTHVTAVDKLGQLAKVTLGPSLVQTITATGGANLYWYFPLSDVAGASNIESALPSTTAQTVTLAASGVPAWQDGSGPGVEGAPAVTLSGGATLNAQFRGTDPASLFDTTACFWQTIMLWSSVPSGQPTSTQLLRVLEYDGATLTISVNTTGKINVRFVEGDGTVRLSGATDYGTSVSDGGVHQLVVGQWFNGVSNVVNVWIDGVDLGITQTVTKVASMTKATLGGSGTCTVSHFAGVGLPPASSGTGVDIFALANGSSATTPSAQLTSLSTWTGITQAFDVSSARSAVLQYTVGRSGLECLNEVARSESGIVYHDYGADSVLAVNRVNYRPATVTLTVDAEADMDGEPVLYRGNVDTVATATGKNATTSVTVVDATLLAQIGSASRDVTSTLGSVNGLGATATDAIAAGKYTRTRVQQIQVDLATAQNDLYASVWNLTLGDRVRLSGLPSVHFGVTYVDGYVLGWTEEPSINGYVVTLDLAPADAPAEAKFDDTTYGRYGWANGAATVTGGTAVGTTATGTLIITTPSGPTLTTAAGAYPLQLDWNGECVTITSAPAGSTSPQTVTITARGQNGTVARSHSTGEKVDIWMSGRFAL